jgi:hypothetical protein
MLLQVIIFYEMRDYNPFYLLASQSDVLCMTHVPAIRYDWSESCSSQAHDLSMFQNWHTFVSPEFILRHLNIEDKGN